MAFCKELTHRSTPLLRQTLISADHSSQVGKFHSDPVANDVALLLLFIVLAGHLTCRLLAALATWTFRIALVIYPWLMRAILLKVSYAALAVVMRLLGIDWDLPPLPTHANH